MNKKLLFTILLSVFFTLNSFSSEIFSINHECQTSFQLNNMNISNYKANSNLTYLEKSTKMRKVGFAGIPVTIIGGILSVSGSIVFGVFYYDYYFGKLYWESLTGEVYNYLTPSYYYSLLGLAISSLGGLSLLGGVAMIVVGFTLSKYYLKKENKSMNQVSMSPYLDIYKDNVIAGFSIKL